VSAKLTRCYQLPGFLSYAFIHNTLEPHPNDKMHVEILENSTVLRLGNAA